MKVGRRNQMTVFLEPGEPPENDEQARLLVRLPRGTIVSTLTRNRAPLLFPPRESVNPQLPKGE